MDMKEVNQRLADLAELKNVKRSSTIIPGSKPILGARIPDLRKLARTIAREDYREFLESCPDDNLEQQILQAFVIGYAKDEITNILSCADAFIPKIQDWCVNDAFCQNLSAARKNREAVFEWLMPYADRKEEYPQRVAAIVLLSHFLVDEYIDDVLLTMNRLKFDGYYTRMGVAWCVATAYAKYPDKTMKFLKENELNDWTYNKSIQKMIESFRVSEEDKQTLRQMKRK